MKFGLLAAGDVGYRVAKFLGDNGHVPDCLVLDNNDSRRYDIINSSRIKPENTHVSDGGPVRDLYIRGLKSCNLDLIFLVWWPYIIPKEVIDIPRLGCINTHYSCLPYSRGKNGNFWTFIENTPFGATLHFVDEGIDSGDIAFQTVIPKTWEDTGGTLYEKVKDATVKLFIDNFDQMIAGDIPRRPQNLLYELHPGSYHNSRELDPASRIDLNKMYTGRELLNLIRARTFLPHPATWFIDHGQKYEVRINITKVKE